MSNPTGPFSHGFKKCIGFQSSTSACRLRIFASDRTIQAWSNLSSIERFNCGQWSSTVRERWSSSNLCAADHPSRQLADSLVRVARMPTCSLCRYQALLQEAARHLARASPRGGLTGQLYVAQLFVTLVTEVSLISRETNLRFERISISRGIL